MVIYNRLRAAEIWITLTVLCAVLLLIGWATITRYLGTPNVWTIEVTQALFAWLCLLSASVAFRSGSHFSVDVLSGWVGKTYEKHLIILRYTIMFVILITLIWVSLDYVAQSDRRKLPLSGIRFSWVALSFPVACALMGLTCLERIVTALGKGTQT